MFMTSLKLSALVLAVGAASVSTAETAQADQVKTEVVMLGAGAGRTSYGGDPAGGFSAAVVVGEARYIVDFGRGWHDRYFEAGLGPNSAVSGFSGLEGIEAAFVTHMHSDHLVDLPELLVLGATEGLRKRKTPMVIVGPASRGSLPPLSPKLKEEPELVNPDNPVPGIRSTVEQLFNAFAADLNDNIRDSGMPPPWSYISVSEIELPDDVPGPDVTVSPDMEPFDIYRDENVTVTAILNNHAPMYPSYALRFDTAAGSIVFSGDTNRNDNVIKLAKDADVLVHEVISTAWARGLFPDPMTAAQEAKLHHLLESHTPTEQVGSVAADAGVKTLVLSHLAPATVPDEEWLAGVQGFDGTVLIGRPLVRVSLN